MGKVATLTKNLLLGFLLISVGFALGREVTARRLTRAAPAVAAADANQVVVYYFHATFRCVTCNKIERLAKTLVETEFAPEVAAKTVVWREVDFQQDDRLASRYGVSASCVVVVRIQDGQEVSFQRMDEVWDLVGRPEAFNEFLRGVIRKQMGAGGA